MKKLAILVEGSGFNLLKANFGTHFIWMDIKKAIKKSPSKYAFFLKYQLSTIQKQLPNGLRLKQLMKETIYLDINSLSTKKIPVIPNFDIRYKSGYNIEKKIKLTPDSILISGVKQQIKSIKKIYLEKLTLKNVTTSFSKKVKLIILDSLKNMKFSHRWVMAKADVSKFTEGTLEIPFTIKNVPTDFKINTFPKTVKIIYKVPLKNFNKITKNSFTVVCDYKRELHFLIPKIVRKPTFATSVRMIPDKITYLIHK